MQTIISPSIFVVSVIYESVQWNMLLFQYEIIFLLQAFRRLYEQVGLGWVYAITKYKPLSHPTILLKETKIFAFLLYCRKDGLVHHVINGVKQYSQIVKIADSVYNFYFLV